MQERYTMHDRSHCASHDMFLDISNKVKKVKEAFKDATPIEREIMLSYDIEDIATREVGFDNIDIFFKACLKFDRQPDLGELDTEPRKSLVHALYESYKICWSDEQ